MRQGFIRLQIVLDISEAHDEHDDLNFVRSMSAVFWMDPLRYVSFRLPGFRSVIIYYGSGSGFRAF